MGNFSAMLKIAALVDKKKIRQINKVQDFPF